MKSRKIMAFLLVFAMLLVPIAVTSCGGEGGGGEDNEIEQDVNKMLSPAFSEEHMTFDNEDYNVLTKADRTKGQAFNVIDLVEEDNLGDVTIVDAVQRRNDLIEQNFKVKINRIIVGSSYGEVNTEASNAVEKQSLLHTSVSALSVLLKLLRRVNAQLGRCRVLSVGRTTFFCKQRA